MYRGECKMRSKFFWCVVGVLFAGLLCGCNKNRKPFDYELYGLNTPVKSVKVTTYKAVCKFGDITKSDIAGWENYLALFNESGNLESISFFDDQGDCYSVEKRRYNNDNVLIETSLFDDEGNLKSQISDEYNGSRMITSTWRILYLDTAEIIVSRYKYEHGRLVEINNMSNGELLNKTIYSRYDKECIEGVIYNKDGQEDVKFIEYFNDNGQIIKRNAGEYCLEVEWNELNLPIKLKGATLHNNTIVAYYTDKENVFDVEYEYDERGNWIRQIVYEGEMKRPKSISEREIIY